MAMSGRDHSVRIENDRTVHINIESLASSLEDMMGDNLYMSPNCCIFKTPEILKRHNEKAYIPNAFSIGPFHHGKANLKATQKIKVKYLQGLLRRARFPEGQLRQLVEAINEVEAEARDCYAGAIGFSVEEFVKILVLDGCFIIELFRKDALVVEKDQDDPIFTMSCLLQFLLHDLILLENQIPWLVLDRLFNMTMTTEGKPLDQLAVEFFGNMFSSQRPSMESLMYTNFQRHRSKHILDLLRNSLVLSIEEHEHELGWQPFPSATSLKEAGIKFKKVVSNSILDMKFRNGVLEVPALLIQETTETIFRNLISFEQCYPNCSPRVTSYVILLDNLINTSKDVTILSENGIIDNWLNPEDAIQFFNKLYHDAYVKDFYYVELCGQVNAYCRRRWPRWRAMYMHNYFGTPWAIVSQVVAAAFLLLTFLETLYTITR